MKYLVILVVVVVLVRIDFFVRLFDQAMDKLQSKNTSVDTSVIKPGEVFKNDQSIQQTPRSVFLALLEDFHSAPTADIRSRALLQLKQNPTILKQTLDPELEAIIFKWRDLLILNNPEAVNFMLDLGKVLQGENLLMLKRFFSLWMEIDMGNFLAAYSRTSDSNCSIATTFGDNIPEEEKINEYYDRVTALNEFLAKEKIEPAQKALATNCLLVLNLEISKIEPPKPLLPSEEPVNNEAEE